MINTAIAPCEQWTFPSDVGWRRQYFSLEAFRHPAKLHLGLLQKLIDRYTLPGDTLFDPMAGSGSLMFAATQQRNVILRELEYEYVSLIEQSVPIIRRAAGLFAGMIDYGQADARRVEVPRFDHIITSPPYGFEASGGMTENRRRRHEQLESLGRKLGQRSNTYSIGFRYAGGNTNIGNKSGGNYWREMRTVYMRMAEIMPAGGMMILILKNHHRRGKLIDVVSQTVVECESIGLTVVERHMRMVDNPSIWQRRRVEQGLPIVDHEDVLVFRRAGL